MYARLCWFSIISVIPSLNIQGKVSIAFFLPLCLSDLVALSAFSGTDFTSFEAFSDIFHSGQIRSPLSLRTVVRDFVLVSFTYTVDFSFLIGTTQLIQIIFCFAQLMLLPYSPQSLNGEKLRGDVYNTLLFDFTT